MTISMYQISVPVCVRALTNLSNVLKKGEKFVAHKEIDPSVLLNSRLAADMLPLIKQVQITSDIAKGAGARLAKIDNPKYEDNENTFPELYARLEKTINFLQSIKPEQIDGSEDRTVVLKLRTEELKFTCLNYLLGFVFPNIGFHTTTTYNILRHNGVEIGKLDYLGAIPTL